MLCNQIRIFLLLKPKICEVTKHLDNSFQFSQYKQFLNFIHTVSDSDTTSPFFEFWQKIFHTTCYKNFIQLKNHFRGFLKENLNVDEIANAAESIVSLLYSIKPNDKVLGKCCLELLIIK